MDEAEDLLTLALETIKNIPPKIITAHAEYMIMARFPGRNGINISFLYSVPEESVSIL